MKNWRRQGRKKILLRPSRYWDPASSARGSDGCRRTHKAGEGGTQEISMNRREKKRLKEIGLRKDLD